jgi:hypothetical protein
MYRDLMASPLPLLGPAWRPVHTLIVSLSPDGTGGPFHASPGRVLLRGPVMQATLSVPLPTRTGWVSRPCPSAVPFDALALHGADGVIDPAVLVEVVGAKRSRDFFLVPSDVALAALVEIPYPGRWSVLLRVMR